MERESRNTPGLRMWGYEKGIKPDSHGSNDSVKGEKTSWARAFRRSLQVPPEDSDLGKQASCHHLPLDWDHLCFAACPMKCIKLFTVELCREVRRGEVMFEEPIELNFLQYTILGSYESTVSEGSGENKWYKWLFKSCIFSLFCINLEN